VVFLCHFGNTVYSIAFVLKRLDNQRVFMLAFYDNPLLVPMLKMAHRWHGFKLIKTGFYMKISENPSNPCHLCAVIELLVRLADNHITFYE
jgi:hypothetical protein